MALPANYDINYYRGNTYKFDIYAKDTDGSGLDLSSYTASFDIADSRGPSPDFSVSATATIDGSYIRCSISPSVGASLVDGPYVYDITVSSGPTEVYTYLTGNIFITQDVEA